MKIRSSALILGLLLLTSGGEARQPAAPAAPAQAATTPTWPMEVVDGFGRKVTIARPPRRIVSVAPSNTEMVFAVGAGDRLVGRTTVCSYPPEAATVPVVGGMTPKTINMEGLVALRPDLILATCGVQEGLIAPLERLGLPVVALDAEDFEGVARNIRLVGALTDRRAAGEDLARRFLDRVDAVRRRVDARPGQTLASASPTSAAAVRSFTPVNLAQRASGSAVTGPR